MKRSLLLGALSITLASLAFGQAPTRGPAGQSGLVYRGSASFWIDAPPGWVLDPDAGKRDGPIVVLYKKGESWRTGEPVMYANDATPKDTAGGMVASVIEADVAEWHTRAADLIVTERDSVRTAGGQVATIRGFQSAAAKHFEAVAYIPGPGRVWLLVLAARSPAAYDAGYAGFVLLVKSYAPGLIVKTP